MADKQRIALFMPALGGGGAERVMLTLAESLADRGLAIDLVVTSARGALRGDVPDNIRLVDLKAQRIMTSLFPLIRYLRREKPQAMLAALAPTNCIAIWARALSCVPLRVVLVEHSTLSKASIGARNRRSLFLPTLMRLSYPRADGVVAVSSGVADDLSTTIKLPRKKIDVIYNPAVTPTMLKKSLESVDHPWFRLGEPPVILGVGRLTRAKDFSLLIRAFAKLREHREARLIILGEGEERQQLETLVSELGVNEHVAMPGFVSNPYAYMRRATLLVLSSQWEGLGNVLIEAMACGTPVVSTDCPSGPREILGDKFKHLLTKVGDQVELEKKIRDSLEQKQSKLLEPDLRFTIDTATNAYMRLLVSL